MEQRTIGGVRLEVVQGDLTEQRVDAIVNAANPSLLGGGGVDGAIHRRGGPEILAECRELRRTRFAAGLPTGQAVATTAGNLPARWVIHTVGPVWQGGTAGEAGLLASAYRNSLRAGIELGAGTIAFPSISTGAYGYPIAEAAPLALSTIAAFVLDHAGDVLVAVRMVAHGDADFRTYRDALVALKP